MKNGICYIVGAGKNYGLNFTRRSDDLIIAADGGLIYLDESSINADFIIGDFDSLDSIPTSENVIRLRTEKDETDMFAAVSHGIKMGYECFHIYCGTGNRTDHTIANIQLLSYLAERNMKGFLFDESVVYTAIKDGSLTFESDKMGIVSVFSLSDISEGVNLEGLKYRLDNANVKNSVSIGVSNEFIGKKSKISVKKGTLLIVFPK